MPDPSEKTTTVSLKKWTTTYVLANLIGALSSLAILNTAFSSRTLIRKLHIIQSSHGLVNNSNVYGLVFSLLALASLTIITYLCLFRLFKSELRMSKLFIRAFPLQIMFGSYFLIIYLTGFLDVLDSEVFIWSALVAIPIICGFIQSRLLFSFSWGTVIRWLLVSLFFCALQAIDFVSFGVTYFVSNGFLLGWPLAMSGLGIMVFLQLLICLCFFLIPCSLVSIVIGILSWMILQPIFPHSLLPSLKKETIGV